MCIVSRYFRAKRQLFFFSLCGLSDCLFRQYVFNLLSFDLIVVEMFDYIGSASLVKSPSAFLSQSSACRRNVWLLLEHDIGAVLVHSSLSGLAVVFSLHLVNVEASEFCRNFILPALTDLHAAIFVDYDIPVDSLLVLLGLGIDFSLREATSSNNLQHIGEIFL